MVNIFSKVKLPKLKKYNSCIDLTPQTLGVFYFMEVSFRQDGYAKEIWEYDAEKIDLIRNNDYNLEVIWESELKNDNKLINKIIENYVKSK